MTTSERPAMSDCPSGTELSLFVIGRMSSERVEAIARHVKQCDSCAAAVAALDSDNDVLVSQLRMKSELEWATPREQLRIINLLTRPVAEGCGEPCDASLLESCPAQTLGDYRLMEKLGAGGMGAAYRAIHTRLGKMVVIKVLPPQRSKDPGAIQRFAREMKAIGAIEHPRIVKALDAGEQDGIHYLVMEHVDGITLSDLVERNGPLEIGHACKIIRQAAAGLAAIHEEGIVHRDIKPSNIMLTHTGEVKLLDLGVALLTRAPERKNDGLTCAGELMGTFEYASPEQLSDSHQVDARSDIFSLGATLYRLVTGQSPLVDDKYSVARRLFPAPPDTPPARVRAGLPRELIEILDRMMSVDVERRIQSCEDVMNALKPLSEPADLGRLLTGKAEHDRGNLPEHSPANTPARAEDTSRNSAEAQRERVDPVSQSRGEKTMAKNVDPAHSNRSQERRCTMCESARFVPFRWPPSSPATDEAFDGYYMWLGIPPSDQPPHHYRLLGINLYEGNPTIINNAADRQINYLRTVETGPHSEQAQRILGEIAAARTCLLDAQEKSAYDLQLRRRLANEQPDSPENSSSFTAESAAQTSAVGRAPKPAAPRMDQDSCAAEAQSSERREDSGDVSRQTEFISLKGNMVELRKRDTGKTVAIPIGQLGQSAYSIMNRHLNVLLELGKKISVASPRHKWEIWRAGEVYILVISGTTETGQT